ncbi:hypothetical protein L3X38_037639 [Prunus dulcis]|uniref:Uncharacterized protein n=1 Tax=Prunus dulcis TaxID=3755 RepID=A0AAD4YPR1_PRUDU|nr:hypothetical protein L3X38_037639 [Prunus dulcis]
MVAVGVRKSSTKFCRKLSKPPSFVAVFGHHDGGSRLRWAVTGKGNKGGGGGDGGGGSGSYGEDASSGYDNGDGGTDSGGGSGDGGEGKGGGRGGSGGRGCDGGGGGDGNDGADDGGGGGSDDNDCGGGGGCGCGGGDDDYGDSHDKMVVVEVAKKQMETIIILVCYNTKWVTSKKMCKYKGGDSKGLIVPQTITFAKLLYRVHQIGNTNCREDNVCLKI